MVGGDGLSDHAAHRDPDEVGVAVSERVQQTDGVARHVAEVVLPVVAAAPQDRQRVRLGKVRVGRTADVAIVEPDHPVSPLGDRGGEFLWPRVLLLSEAGDQQDRGRCGVTERVVTQLDAATDRNMVFARALIRDEGVARHADTSAATAGTALGVRGERR
jgi:hypothetical protein